MRRRRKAYLATGILGGMALLWVGAFLLPEAFACSDEERAVFEEFDQYVGSVEPHGNSELSSCAAGYETSDPKEEVFAYFEERLEEHGWQQRPEEAPQARGEGGEFETAGLVAERDGFRYEVGIDNPSVPSDPDSPGPTHVVAHVISGR